MTTGTTLDSIGYLGDGTIVSEEYGQPGRGIQSVGHDRRAPEPRPISAAFRTRSGATTAGMIDGYGYTYTPQGDVASKQNLALDAYKTANPSSTAPYLDEVYGNNVQDGLTSLARGELDPAAVDQLLSGSTDFTQGWTLDGIGNWSAFQQGRDVEHPTLVQNRTPTAANEIHAINNTTGIALADAEL